MVFSISRTTISGLNFNLYFFIHIVMRSACFFAPCINGKKDTFVAISVTHMAYIWLTSMNPNIWLFIIGLSLFLKYSRVYRCKQVHIEIKYFLNVGLKLRHNTGVWMNPIVFVNPLCENSGSASIYIILKSIYDLHDIT